MPKTRRQGFTLIEVMVAVTILAMALGSAAFLLISAFGTYRHQNQSMELFHVSHDKMETIVGTSYDKLQADMDHARAPADPIRDGMPPDHDFVKTAAGDVNARYELVPEAPDSDKYKLVPHRDGQMLFDYGPKQRGKITATVRLQYWDPVFDAPSVTDRGLIRASLVLKGDSGTDTAAKYVAR